MIIIRVKKGDKIDKYLKKFKKKFDQTKVLKKVRANMYFVKKSVKRRNEILKAAYNEKIQLSKEK
ncbi:MAG: 30S ribosomal protein S21 [Bacteroidetes bacterium]|nr:30S ribosomal protein S21 [Bacteroidota bacterium]